jgi:hypothetical protein
LLVELQVEQWIRGAPGVVSLVHADHKLCSASSRLIPCHSGSTPSQPRSVAELAITILRRRESEPVPRALYPPTYALPLGSTIIVE